MSEKEKLLTEKIQQSVVNPTNLGQIPKFEILLRTLKNTEFDSKTGTLKILGKTMERKLNDMSAVRAFFQTCYTASQVKEILTKNDFASLRDLFYNSKFTIPGSKVESYEEQLESDAIVKDLEVLLGLSREEFNILCSPKGVVSGNITLISKGKSVDARETGELGITLTSNVDKLDFKDVTADFVLCVEKGAVWEKLHDYQFWKDHNCILVTGKGQPDRPTRRFLRRMNDEYSLPIYILTDADPYGFYIYSTYKIGSISLSYESEKLACPKAKFLGVSISDIYYHKLPERVIIKAKEEDIKRAQELLKYPWFSSDSWKREIELFLKKQEKVEIEAFSKFGFKYLSDSYLPTKIQTANFLE